LEAAYREGTSVSWLSQHVHLGDLPTSLAAIGAIIAAAFAFGQLRALRIQNRLQQRELDGQTKDIARVEETQRKQTELLDLEIRERRSAQARQVEIQRFVRRWSDPGSGVENGYALFVRVTNNSHGAISNLDALFACGDETPRRGIYSQTAIQNNPAQSSKSRLMVPRTPGPAPVERLDPGYTVNLVGPTYDKQTANATRGEFLFTDSDGRRWTTSHTGQLTEVSLGTPIE
jgi:hypothetical protein